jgi:hypothetical protein
MDVTLLYFDGCPNSQEAHARLREAITRLDRTDVRLTHRQVRSAEEAEQLSFHGSPTILVDGRDPFADPGAPVGLSCRIYRSPAGVAGAPTVEQIIDALGDERRA